MNSSVGAFLQRMMVSSVVLSIALNATSIPAWAGQTIKNPSHPINAKLKTDVWGPTAQAGETFEAELSEDLHYKTWTLPSGTVFKGQVSKVQHSRTLGRPGYVVLNVDEAALPDGSTFEFDESKYKPRNAKLHEKEALTFTQSVVQQMPASAAGLGATLPLQLADAVSGTALIPVGLGVRMLAGATYRVFKPKTQYQKQGVPAQVAYGALEGSGIVRLMGLVSKYPEPEYKVGDIIKLHFNGKGLKDLFVASAQGLQNVAVPVTPQDPVVPPPAKQEDDEPTNIVKTPTEQQESATGP